MTSHVTSQKMWLPKVPDQAKNNTFSYDYAKTAPQLRGAVLCATGNFTEDQEWSSPALIGQLGCTIATVGEEALSTAGPPEMFPPASPGPPSEELLSPGSEPPEEGSAST